MARRLRYPIERYPISKDQKVYWVKVEKRIRSRLGAKSLASYVKGVCHEGGNLRTIASRARVPYRKLYGLLARIGVVPIRRGDSLDKIAIKFGFSNFENYINDRYWKKELSLKDLEKETGKTRQAILNKMRKVGVKRRNISAASRISWRKKAKKKK